MHNDRFLQKLKKLLQEWLIPKAIPKPSTLILTQIGKVTMLNYKVTLPTATAADVTSWNLETTVNSGAPTVAVVTDAGTVSFNQGDTVSLRVQEVDDAGNASEWSDPLAFTASDTLAPAKPGALSVTLVDETP